MNKRQKSFHLIADAVLAFLCILLDQYTKKLAVMHLKDQPAKILINKVFCLYYLENRGAAFGMFQNRQVIFLIVSVVFCLALIYMLIKVPINKRFYLAEAVFVLLFAGAIGNMIDRVSNGFVVDFFYFELIDFPVFNVADIYVTVSCFALMILILFVYKEEDIDSFKIASFGKKSNEKI